MVGQHIYVLVGVSGSGKSTIAKSLAKSGKYVRVNRDDLRCMLFGYTDEDIDHYYNTPGIQYREGLVTKVQDKIIREGIKAKKSIIVDNTNLKAKYIKELKKYKLPLRYQVMDTPLKICIQRDQNRKRSVGKVVIEKQWSNLEKLKQSGIFDL